LRGYQFHPRHFDLCGFSRQAGFSARLLSAGAGKMCVSCRPGGPKCFSFWTFPGHISCSRLDELKAADRLPTPSGVALSLLRLTAAQSSSAQKIAAVLVPEHGWQPGAWQSLATLVRNAIFKF
jgi:hypothetical protein